MSDYGSRRSDLEDMGPAFWLERPDLGSERSDWGSERPASGFERLHFGSKTP